MRSIITGGMSVFINHFLATVVNPNLVCAVPGLLVAVLLLQIMIEPSGVSYVSYCIS